MRISRIAVSAVTLSSLSAPAYAYEIDLADTHRKVKTIAENLLYRANEFVSLPDKMHFIAYSPEEEIEEATQELSRFDRDIKMFADIRPDTSDFLLSTGIHITEKFIHDSSVMAARTQYSEMGLSPSEVGVLHVDTSAKNIAGFAGIGFDNSHRNTKWNYKVIAGAAFNSDPKLTFVTRDQYLDVEPVFLSQLEETKGQFTEDLSRFQVSPVIHAKLSFKF